MRLLTKPRLTEMVPYFALPSEAEISGKGKELAHDEDTWEDYDDFSDCFTAIESSAASTIKRKYSSSSETSTVRPMRSLDEKWQEKNYKEDYEEDMKKDGTLYTGTGNRSRRSSTARFFARLRRLGKEWVASRAREAKRFRISRPEKR